MAEKKKKEVTIRSSAAEYLTYIASVGDNADSMEMRYEDENIWLTQKMMATLYDVEVNTINYHIKKIFQDSELQEDSVIRNFRITAVDGKSYNTKHYNLNAIIAVGFKVNNQRAVRFRVWANQIVEQYTVKGWAMDVERLKNGNYSKGNVRLNVSESVVKEIAKRQPLRAVFRDSSFASSPAKINVREFFKMIAPDTRVRVI